MAKPKILATAQVRCSGKLHKISLTETGRLIFHGHDKGFIAQEQAYAALGGEPCRCYEVLKNWRIYLARDLKRNISKIPREFHKLIKEKEDLGLQREISQIKTKDPLKHYTLEKRIEIRTRKIAIQELDRCGYRRSRSNWAGGVHKIRVYICNSPLDVKISGESEEVWSDNGKWRGNNSIIKVQVYTHWLPRVYKKGISVVGGNFVLDVLEELPDEGYIVLAGKQGKGFNIYPCKAKILRKNGEYKLKWLKE